MLTGHALGLTTLDLALRENDPVTDSEALKVAELLERRMSGESVARVIGFREFYGLPFILNEATLEPRPETELLVDLALGALPAGGRVLDLGTGTGCIPISVLANQPDATAIAVDLSDRAIEAARANAESNGVGERLTLLHGSWFEPLASRDLMVSLSNHEVGYTNPATTSSFDKLRMRSDQASRFDLILSNPPYITSAVVETLEPEVKDFDPRLALDGGPDGLAPYRVIAREAAEWLKPGGWVIVEIGYDQGADVSALFIEAGYGDVTVHKDLNQLDRVVCAHHI